MSDSTNSIDRASRITPLSALAEHRRQRPPAADVAPQRTVEAASFDGVSATVPDAVLAEIGDAMDRLEDLQAQGRSVRVTADGGAGPRIELVDADGRAEALAPTALFDVVSGDRDAARAAAPAPSSGHVDREA
ncbi:hypothetical protein [Patulibacter minatonensis]|uniref:hypothetical protein n=1 Tax=Patulibacter minatonensis TaxID=298163 RepID=UPI0004791CC5|nr:hypothetical protein [Patulibacter minatonensis]